MTDKTSADDWAHHFAERKPGWLEAIGETQKTLHALYHDVENMRAYIALASIITNGRFDQRETQFPMPYGHVAVHRQMMIDWIEVRPGPSLS